MSKMDQLVKQNNIKEKRFSIIIPAYNVEKYIERCIESVKNQTFNSYEIIIIDSVSNDNTVEILKKYVSDNTKIFQQKNNLGPGGARNVGLNKATGEYILFLDADDYLNNDKIGRAHV